MIALKNAIVMKEQLMNCSQTILFIDFNPHSIEKFA